MDILEDVLQAYIKAFGLDLHDSVIISPKFPSNFTVNSGVNSAIDALIRSKKRMKHILPYYKVEDFRKNMNKSKQLKIISVLFLTAAFYY